MEIHSELRSNPIVKRKWKEPKYIVKYQKVHMNLKGRVQIPWHFNKSSIFKYRVWWAPQFVNMDPAVIYY